MIPNNVTAWLELLFEYRDYLRSPRGTKRRRGIVKQMVTLQLALYGESVIMTVLGRPMDSLPVTALPSEVILYLMAHVAAERLPFWNDGYTGPRHQCYMQDYKHLFTSTAT